MEQKKYDQNEKDFSSNKKAFIHKYIYSNIIIICLFGITVFAWSIIVLGKFYSLHSSVFDLGFVMERLWQPYHIISFNFYTNVLFSSGFQFVLSPIYFFHSFQLLLIVQVIAVEIAVFPLYAIAIKLTNNKMIGILISVSYLLYFPSAGILWFDVHFQAFFVPLFVFAYYFYIKEKYFLSALFFILSGTVRFPYMVYPLIFSIFELTFRSKNFVNEKDRMNSNIIILIVSSIFLIFGYYFDVFSVGPGIIKTTSSSLSSNLYPVFLTFVIIMSPLLFLPMLRLKWLIMALPFFLLGLYSGSPVYVYPEVLTDQYTSMILPIVFIGTIETLSKINNSNKIRFIGNMKLMLKIPKRLRNKFRHNRISTMFSIGIFIVLLTGSLFYAPYGPYNSAMKPNYSFNHEVSFNETNYRILMQIESLIPKNNTYVLFQNDMPEFLPRASGNEPYTFLFSTHISNNLTLSEVINNTFPLLSIYPNYPGYTKVDYLVAYTQSSQYFLQFAPNENTLPKIMTLMIESGKYGILAEDKGFIALERDYQAPPKIYEPLVLNESFGSSGVNSGISFTNVTNIPVTLPGYVNLVPGTYSVTYSLSISTNNGPSFLNAFLGFDLGSKISQVAVWPISNINQGFKYINVTWNITVPNQESYTVFELSSINYHGVILVHFVRVSQTSYDYRN